MSVINIKPGTFGGKLRMGDLVATCNAVEYIRKKWYNFDIQFNVDINGVSGETHCIQFYNWLLENTNYFTTKPGTETLPWSKVNLWDLRDMCGDLVKIPNTKPMQKKIVIFPLNDANYNQYRNWPSYILPQSIGNYQGSEYDDYEKIICVKDLPNKDKFEPNYADGIWKYSTDFMENIHHIQTAEIFIGGDTGTTHFAFALDRSPKTMLYYNSSRALVHTLPFYLMEGKGKMTSYWLDFEDSTWQ